MWKSNSCQKSSLSTFWCKFMNETIVHYVWEFYTCWLFNLWNLSSFIFENFILLKLLNTDNTQDEDWINMYEKDNFLIHEHHFDKLIIVQLSVSIHISFSHEFLDLILCQCCPQHRCNLQWIQVKQDQMSNRFDSILLWLQAEMA